MTHGSSEPIATAHRAGGGADPWGKVLVFHIGSLGDTVLSIPALQALRAHVGADATITLLHDSGSLGRVAPIEIIPAGLIDETMTFVGPRRESHPVVVGGRRLVHAIGLLGRIHRRRFDAVINLALADRSRRALRRDQVFFRLGGIRTIIGFDTEQAGQQEAAVRLGRLQRAGVPAYRGDGPWFVADPPGQVEAEHWKVSAGLPADRPIVTVAPGTLMDAKRWPVDRWEALGSRLRDELDLVPVVVGGPADRDDGDRLVAAWGGGANAAGALSPQGSAALMATAVLHIGVDTGTTHLAAACGRPVVALYSHRAPIEQWAPLGKAHRIVDHTVPCAGCQAVDCPVAGHPCMTGITLNEVWVSVEAALDPAAKSAARG